MKNIPGQSSWAKIITGSLVILNSLYWLSQNIEDYYIYSYTVVRCGNGVPTKLEILIHCVLSLVGMWIGYRLIKGRIKLFKGSLLHLSLIVFGIFCILTRG